MKLSTLVIVGGLAYWYYTTHMKPATTATTPPAPATPLLPATTTTGLGPSGTSTILSDIASITTLVGKAVI